MLDVSFPVEQFKNLTTPFYYYDMELLRATIAVIKQETENHPFQVHYALKANANSKVLKLIQQAGLGADCVSGGEVQAALDAGIPADKIVFAGVGKADWEINLGIDNDIFCFNVESLPELEVIHELAAQKNKTVQIALRINPNVQANTHAYITTGLEENKFGINLSELDEVLQKVKNLRNVVLIGLHVHIGSQITDMSAYADMCERINDLQLYFEDKGFKLKHINVGGGLGVNYEQPDAHLIPDFASYFKVFRKKLKLRPAQIVHFELGRSVVAQCGSLIAKVLYIKKGSTKQYAILDAGMTELIRPALYQAYHHIQNLSSALPSQVYDVVGPICESTDVFATDYYMPTTQRGDLIAIRSAGAYGETMASRYNLRDLPVAYSSEEILIGDY
jgi:diaminopimelate decarboxylase